MEWKFDFTGMSKYFFSASGIILMVGAIAFSTQQLNLGIDFESGTRITAALAEDASAEEVRTALNDAGIDGIDSAEIQSVENEDFGANVIQMQAKIPPDQAPAVQDRAERRLRARGRRPGLPERIRRTDLRPAGGRERGQGPHHVAARDLRVRGDQVRGQVRGAGADRALPRHPDHRRHLCADGAGGDERDRGCLPHHLGLLDVRHDHRVRPNPRERAAHAARGVLPDREPLDGRGPHAIAHHRPLDRLPGRHDPHLRRRDPARLRLRDDGRDRLRYLLVDLHRRARTHRMEGARAHLSRAPPPHRGDDGLRAGLPRGQRRRPRRGTWRTGRRARAKADRRRACRSRPRCRPTRPTRRRPPARPRPARFRATAPSRQSRVTGPPGAAETDGAGAAGDRADPAVAHREAAQRERRRQRQKRRKHGRNR